MLHKKNKVFTTQTLVFLNNKSILVRIWLLKIILFVRYKVYIHLSHKNKGWEVSLLLLSRVLIYQRFQSSDILVREPVSMHLKLYRTRKFDNSTQFSHEFDSCVHFIDRILIKCLIKIEILHYLREKDFKIYSLKMFAGQKIADPARGPSYAVIYSGNLFSIIKIFIHSQLLVTYWPINRCFYLFLFLILIKIQRKSLFLDFNPTLTNT